MQHILLVYNDPALLDALPAGEADAMMRECLAYADELRHEGRLVDSRMLTAAAAARAVRIRHGRQTAIDGPFAETKEVLGGFYLVEARDMDEALEIAARIPWARTGCIEVRPVEDVAAVRQRVHGSLAPAVAGAGGAA